MSLFDAKLREMMNGLFPGSMPGDNNPTPDEQVMAVVLAVGGEVHITNAILARLKNARRIELTTILDVDGYRLKVKIEPL